MQFEFEKSMLQEKDNLENLHSSYPNMFIFVKDEDGTAKPIKTESSSGSQRYTESHEKYSDKYRFHPTYLIDPAKEAQKNGATHLITGYYNIIEDRFVQNVTFTLPEHIDDTFVINVANKVLTEQFNEMYFDNELLLANLKWRDDNRIMLHLDYPDLFQNITHVTLHNFVSDYFKKNQDELEVLDIGDGKESLAAIKLVHAIMEEFNITPEPRVYFAIQQVLSVHEYCEILFYNKKTKLYDFMDGRLGNIDLHEVMKTEEANDVFPFVVIHHRLKTMHQ